MDEASRSTTLTMRELEALKRHKYNLTDAHPRYKPIGSQQETIEALGLEPIFDAVRKRPYEDLVQNFKRAFYSLAGQSKAIQVDREDMMCYSASLGIQIIASFIRSKGFKTALLEPAFDNVVGILRAEQAKLVPLPEERLKDIEEYLNEFDVDAIWITMPNNPTGWALSEAEFRQLIAACKKRNILLVADFCFRFFCRELATWDQYAPLEESGITYATIEDTGKTWSVHDLKLGIVQSSLDIHDNLYYYYDNHLLSVSPFILHLLAELIDNTKSVGFDNTICKVVSTNSDTVAEIIAGTILEYVPPRSMPVAWLRITDHNLHAMKLYELCKREGVHILPGPNFFWHNPELGRQFIRVSLVRDTSEVMEGMRKLQEILLGLNSKLRVSDTSVDASVIKVL
jgi:aspartate/methionine/tyrosine aminotransferase